MPGSSTGSGPVAGDRLGRGIAGAVAAGLLAGLFGIGGGIVLVPVMHLLMGVPLRVATATSAVVVGVTATSAALAYLVRDGIDVVVAGPVVLGSVAGAWSGARLAPRVDPRLLRLLLAGMLALAAGPLLRLVGGAVAFLRAGDRRSALLAVAVVAAVALNVAIAAAGASR